MKKSELDRLPPHSIEAEQAILGCILTEPWSCMMECGEKFGNDSGIFYDLRHRTLFEVIAGMIDDGSKVDLVTITQNLRDRNLIEAVGGMAYISELPDTVPSATALSHYIEIAQEKQTLRKVIRFSTDLAAEAYECSDVPALVDSLESRALGVRREDSRGFSDIRKVQERIIADAQDAFDGKPIVGFSTGLHDLDMRIGVIEHQTVIMLSGVPSAGKTSLAVNIINHVLHAQQHHVGVFSMETSDVRFVRRMMCADMKIVARNLKSGAMTDNDFVRLTSANARLKKAASRLHLSDLGGLTVAQLRAKARRMHQLGVRFFVIDYLQLLSSGKHSGNRTEELDYISKSIKEMAKELDCVILAIASESKGGGIRGSAQFDYDADAKWRLETDSTDTIRDVLLQITKDKESGFGEVKLTFFADTMRFESHSKIMDADVPAPPAEAAPAPYAD